MIGKEAAQIWEKRIVRDAHPRCQMACGVYSAAVFAMCGGGELSGAVKAGIASALSYYRKLDYTALLERLFRRCSFFAP